MSIVLWILQSLLALHTVIGAVWKFTNPEQTIPSLKVIPHGVWLSLSAVELLCGVALILPAIYRPAAILAPIAAAVIAAEMLAFSALHLGSAETNNGPMVYWLVVAALCAFIAYGRFSLSPIPSPQTELTSSPGRGGGSPL